MLLANLNDNRYDIQYHYLYSNFNHAISELLLHIAFTVLV